MRTLVKLKTESGLVLFWLKRIESCSCITILLCLFNLNLFVDLIESLRHFVYLGFVDFFLHPQLLSLWNPHKPLSLVLTISRYCFVEKSIIIVEVRHVSYRYLFVILHIPVRRIENCVLIVHHMECLVQPSRVRGFLDDQFCGFEKHRQFIF